jgi:hypothetical protein
VSPDEMDLHDIKLTLKINTTDLRHIIATLERFQYRITAQFQEAGEVKSDQDRLDMLLKYLDL